MIDSIIRLVFALIVAFLVYLILVWALGMVGFVIPEQIVSIIFVLVVLALLYKYLWPHVRI